MRLKLISFGFRFGVPAEASLILDARSIRNPHHDPALRLKTGLDSDVSLRVLESKAAVLLLEYASTQITLRLEEGKQEFTLGIGCTSGRHRSVALVEELVCTQNIRLTKTIIMHRDLARREEGIRL